MDTRPPLLDQFSSQALARLAAERGQTLAVVSAGEEAVPPPRRSWKRWLPYLFFALSLFALWGMALGLFALADGGWTLSDVVQVALMALLVAGVFSQARAMLRPTRAGRWLTVRPRTVTPPPARAVPLAGHHLDAVSAEDLADLRPAALAAPRRLSVARRKSGQFMERAAVVTVVVLGLLAFLGMVFILGYMAWASSPWDPAVWLTAPFSALTGYGVFQLVRAARRSAFRGRPGALVSRAFRDSVRVWGSGSLAARVAMTTTATASVAGAAAAPMILPAATYDLFAFDSGSGVMYRIDLDTRASNRLGASPAEAPPLSLGTTASAVALSGGGRLPRTSLLTVVQSKDGKVQGVVGFRPGSRAPVPLARIDPPLPGAQFTSGPGVIYALQPDGTFWRIDPVTGVAKRAGQVAAAPGPMTYDAGARVVIMLSGTKIVRVNPADGRVAAATEIPVAAGFRACGIARGPKDFLFVTEAVTGRILVLRMNRRTVHELRPTGDAPAAACAITVALRK